MSERTLDGVQVGDEVVLAFGWDSQRLAVVERLTPTQVIVKGAGQRFKRPSGHAIGGHSTIWLATDEDRQRLRLRDIRRRLTLTTWDHITDDVVKQVWALVNPPEDTPT
jgi:hypothetical protein